VSGIGNSLETDLVGEVIELWRVSVDRKTMEIAKKLIARGLCRAVTSIDDGRTMLLWLEIRTEADIKGCVFTADVSIGDVLPFPTDDGGQTIRMRLVKQP